MIRALQETDRPALEKLLHQSPHFNVYMLGNLASLGVTHEISEFWGDFSPHEFLPHRSEISSQGGTKSVTQQTPAQDRVENNTSEESRSGEEEKGQPGPLRAVINRYMTGWSVFGRADADWTGLAQVLEQYPHTAERLQDNPGGVASFTPYLQRYEAAHAEEEELMTLAAARFRPVAPRPDFQVRRACLADLDELTEFYAAADTMRRTRKGVERPLNDGYFWVAIIQGKIRATALTNAVSGEYAMIGGVYTHPAWRGRGLSQAVCSALCNALFADGLVPSLYWRTPAAGHVYRKLGFEAVGTWRSVWLAQRADTPQTEVATG